METGKNMGDIFREVFKDYEKKPSDKIWDNIENAVKPQTVPQINFFKPINLMIGSAAIIAVSILLFFIVSNKQSQTPRAASDKEQLVENKQITPIVKDQSPLLISSKKTNELHKNSITIQNNTVENNVTLEKPVKKQNIHDLIAQVDNNQSVTGDVVKQNALKTKLVSKATNSNTNQKNIEPLQSPVNNTIVSRSLPISTISFSPDQTICKGEKATLSVNGGISFLWSTGEKTQYILVNPLLSTDYSVIVTDETGNRKTGLITVTVADCNAPFIPNAFSPNGDGNSDVFKVYGDAIRNFEIIIISRSGQTVFASKNVNEAWDGTIKGRPAQEGVYVYTIKYINELNKEQVISGHVTLIR